MIFTPFPRKRGPAASALQARRTGGVKGPISHRGAVKALTMLLSLTAGLMLMPAINQAASQRLDDRVLPGPHSLLAPVAVPGLTAMGEEEMASVAGQALFMASHERGTTGSTTFDFYKMGLDAQLDLNLNIAELKLGEDASGVDLWIRNFSMGCIGTTANPLTADCNVAGAGTTESGKVLKPFSLLRPYLQIAVKNDGNPALREVVGIRLGAQNAQGPFSAGNFVAFSGYMSGKANLTLEGAGGGTSPQIQLTDPKHDGPPSGCASGNLCRGVALTEDSDFRETGKWDPNNQSAATGYNFGFTAQDLAGLANTREILAKFASLTRTNRNVIANGRRLNQALVYDMQLSSLVDSLANTGCGVNQGCLDVTATTNGLGVGLLGNATILNAFLDSISRNLKSQLRTGLGVADNTALENYKLPFNLENFHSTMVNSSLFGLSFQKENVQYPGYAVPMQKGWSMYLPDAFSLNISAPTTVLVNNIVNSTADTAGNITGLPANAGGRVYDNCWGSSAFC